jgi:hypothetical protein
MHGGRIVTRTAIAAAAGTYDPARTRRGIAGEPDCPSKIFRLTCNRLKLIDFHLLFWRAAARPVLDVLTRCSRPQPSYVWKTSPYGNN